MSEMKINLKPKDDKVVHVGANIYVSDKEFIDEYTRKTGISLSNLIKSLINNLQDGELTIVSK